MAGADYVDNTFDIHSICSGYLFVTVQERGEGECGCADAG